MAEEDGSAIEKVMSVAVTPEIPDACQWFSFLRCHDELTLEMVSPEERKYIFNYYAKDASWDFRQGEGISARLADLFDRDPKRICLAYSIMFTLIGTPVIYYGDEIAKLNDYEYFDEMYKLSGYKDSRYLGRGRMDWKTIDEDLKDPKSLASQIYNEIKAMTKLRAQHPAFARGTLEFIEAKKPDGTVNKHILAYRRAYQDDQVCVLQNLSSVKQVIDGESVMLKDKIELEAV